MIASDRFRPQPNSPISTPQRRRARPPRRCRHETGPSPEGMGRASTRGERHREASGGDRRRESRRPSHPARFSLDGMPRGPRPRQQARQRATPLLRVSFVFPSRLTARNRIDERAPEIHAAGIDPELVTARLGERKRGKINVRVRRCDSISDSQTTLSSSEKSVLLHLNIVDNRAGSIRPSK